MQILNLNPDFKISLRNFLDGEFHAHMSLPLVYLHCPESKGDEFIKGRVYYDVPG
jgi:hypothetical protein